MKGIDTLTYRHILSNSEELVLSLAFTVELNDVNSFVERAKYMYETMKDAIDKREAQIKVK